MANEKSVDERMQELEDIVAKQNENNIRLAKYSGALKDVLVENGIIKNEDDFNNKVNETSVRVGNFSMK